MVKAKWIFLFVLAFTATFSDLTVNVEGQTTKLKVTAIPTILQAGFNTTVAINILNDFEPIYDVDVSISFPQSQTSATSPTAIGTSSWKFSKIKFGENVTVKPLIFVPVDAAGNGYTANIQISYKRLGYISPSSEVHAIGFYAQGWISMVAYDFAVEVEPITLRNAGATLTITASLLNKGNVPAMFTNVTLIPSPILTLKPESQSYLGEVDPNSPAPFTLEATVNPDTEEGNYTVKIKVQYEDEESRIHVFEKEVNVYVTVIQEQQLPSTSERIIKTVTDTVKRYMLFVIIGILVIIIAALMVRRSRRSSFESNASQP